MRIAQAIGRHLAKKQAKNKGVKKESAGTKSKGIGKAASAMARSENRPKGGIGKAISAKAKSRSKGRGQVSSIRKRMSASRKSRGRSGRGFFGKALAAIRAKRGGRLRR